VAEIFGTAEKTIRDWIQGGELMAIKYGKQLYITEAALRGSLQLKDEQARNEMHARRQHAMLSSSLARARQREPELVWELTECIVCDKIQVLTSRYSRDDGRVVCDECNASNAHVGRESAERRAHLRVRERNRTFEQTPEQQRRSRVAPWTVYHCGIGRVPATL